jgi:hypothetical protein
VIAAVASGDQRFEQVGFAVADPAEPRAGAGSHPVGLGQPG